jgi:hypothetical protein
MAAMSASGQKATFPRPWRISALPQNADIECFMSTRPSAFLWTLNIRSKYTIIYRLKSA